MKTKKEKNENKSTTCYKVGERRRLRKSGVWKQSLNIAQFSSLNMMALEKWNFYFRFVFK